MNLAGLEALLFKKKQKNKQKNPTILNTQILSCTVNCIGYVLSRLQEEHDDKYAPIIFHMCNEH